MCAYYILTLPEVVPVNALKEGMLYKVHNVVLAKTPLLHGDEAADEVPGTLGHVLNIIREAQVVLAHTHEEDPTCKNNDLLLHQTGATQWHATVAGYSGIFYLLNSKYSSRWALMCQSKPSLTSTSYTYADKDRNDMM